MLNFERSMEIHQIQISDSYLSEMCRKLGNETVCYMLSAYTLTNL